MTDQNTDRIAGVVLTAASALWCWAAIVFIPSVDDPSRLGSRGFPLGLGVLLGVLGAMLIVSSLRSSPSLPDGSAATADAASPADDPAEPIETQLWAVAVTLALIVGYGIALEQFGFIIATAATVVVAIVLVLRILKPVLILGLAIGMALGVYLVFGKLLGVYLPHGQIVDLVF